MQKLNLKKIVQNSKWSKSQIEALLSMEEKFGSAVLIYLNAFVPSLGSEFEADFLISALEKYYEAENNLDTNPEKINYILSEKCNTKDFDFGGYLVCPLIDFKSRNLISSPELKKQVANFIFSHFQQIPFEAIEITLNNYFLELLQSGPLLLEIKETLIKDYIYKSTKIKTLKNLLESDLEVLGTKKIVFGEKVVEPQVKFWIEDFITNTGINEQGVSFYDVVQYNKNSKNVSMLSKKELELLNEILRIYVWLYKPVLSAKEISEYVDQKRRLLLSQDEQINNTSELDLKNKENDIISFVSKLNIDQKLEDLKKRAKK